MTEAELRQAIADAEAKRTAAQASRDQATAERTDLEGQRDTLNAEIARLSREVQDVTNAIPPLTDRIGAAETEIAALTAEIARLQKELDDMATALGPVGISMGHWPADSVEERKADVVAIKQIGFTWMRTGINWSGTEKTAGEITTYTATVIGTVMKDHGMKWLCVLAYSPKFYSLNPTTDKAAPKPEYYDEWERWVKAQVQAIAATGIPVANVAFEIWNEENHVPFFDRPDPAIYVKLLKRARRAIKSVNTGFKVVFGGMAPAPDRAGTATVKPSYRPSTFVRKCYEAGMSSSDFDEMNFHPYNGQQTLAATAGKSWDMNTTIYNEIYAEMSKHGDGQKKMNSTEFGYYTDTNRKVSEADQATLLVDQIKFLRSRPTAGVSYVFNWRELAADRSLYSNSFGIMRHKTLGGGPKPAVAAIKKYLAANPSR